MSGAFRLGIRKNVFSKRVVRHWKWATHSVNLHLRVHLNTFVKLTWPFPTPEHLELRCYSNVCVTAGPVPLENTSLEEIFSPILMEGH